MTKLLFVTLVTLDVLEPLDCRRALGVAQLNGLQPIEGFFGPESTSLNRATDNPRKGKAVDIGDIKTTAVETRPNPITERVERFIHQRKHKHQRSIIIEGGKTIGGINDPRAVTQDANRTLWIPHNIYGSPFHDWATFDPQRSRVP
jgi:hypothetical protein